MHRWGGRAVGRSAGIVGWRVAVIAIAACTPVTRRPDFQPFPQAPSLVLVARPPQVIAYLATLVQAESMRVRRLSPADGYLETEWYDTRTRRSYHGVQVSDLARTIKLRGWADPYVPGETVLTIELAYRPRYDPSRTDRDLEQPLAKGQDGAALAEELLGKLKERFGTP
jgi:hypothetical protein